MIYLPAIVLVSVSGMMLAYDVPLPVEMTALAMVGVILHFFLRRDASSHTKHDIRLTRIEAELDNQRTAKHALRNELTAFRASLAMLLPTAKNCTCGAMASLVPIIERLTTELRSNDTGEAE